MGRLAGSEIQKIKTKLSIAEERHMQSANNVYQMQLRNEVSLLQSIVFSL